MASWIDALKNLKDSGVTDSLMTVGTLVVAGYTYLAARAARDSAKAAERGLHDQREATAIDILLDLSARFESREYMQHRSLAANTLLMQLGNIQLPNDNQLPGSASRLVHLDTVLDFLELLGFLYKRGDVPEEAMWSLFGHWVAGYYQAAKPYIAQQRNIDPTYYCDLTDLAKALQHVQKRRNPASPEQWSTDQLIEFIKTERALSIPT